MKTSKTAFSLLASLALLAGCGKSSETPATQTPQPAEVPKPAIEKTPPAVTNTAAAGAATAEVHAAANTQADAIIDQTKALISQSKYSEALSTVQKLSGMTLTDSQTALVNSFKDEIKKGIAAQATTNAAGAVNGLLPK